MEKTGADADNGEGAAAQLKVLQEQMAAMQLRHEEQMRILQQQMETAETRDVRVNVQPTLHTPKLKIFTGLPPTNNQEVSFEEWRQQVTQTIDDDAIHDKGAFLRRSLRGAALKQVNDLKTNDAKQVLKHLTTLFGVIKSPEEEYLEICQLKPKKDQALVDFLLVLYSRMNDLQERGKFQADELKRRLYYAFSKGCNNPLLALECRNKFGIPGEATPAFEDLYRYLRQVQDLEPATKRRGGEVSNAHSGAHSAETTARGSRKSYCFKCGEDSHFYRECTNPANAKLVAEREREKKRKTNEWRQKKGLPTLPLN